jgi:hypothetical protein
MTLNAAARMNHPLVVLPCYASLPFAVMVSVLELAAPFDWTTQSGVSVTVASGKIVLQTAMVPTLKLLLTESFNSGKSGIEQSFKPFM